MKECRAPHAEDRPESMATEGPHRGGTQNQVAAGKGRRHCLQQLIQRIRVQRGETCRVGLQLS